MPCPHFTDISGHWRLSNGAICATMRGRELTVIRLATRAAQIVIELSVLAAAFAIAFLARFDWAPPHEMIKRLFFMLPYVVVLQYVLLMMAGMHRAAWRYVGLRDATRIFISAVVSAVLLFVLRAIAIALLDRVPLARYAIVPGGVIVIDFAVVFLGITGVRVLRRMQAEAKESARYRPPRADRAIPTLLVGAGQAGVMVAREIAARPDLGIHPVGFVDDDRLKLGTDIHGLRVLGTTEDLMDVAARSGAKQALIAMASANGRAIRRVTEAAKAAGLAVKIIPGVYEIVGGKIGLSRIRDVAIEDLLRRAPVQLDLEAMGELFGSRTVLVTGAGGSIGSELCRQVLKLDPERVVLLDVSENNLFHIDRELMAELGDRCVSYLADVKDVARMRAIMAAERPDIVFHAAANKHVPILERHPEEGVKNNVLGTRVVADLADELGVGAFVLVSTDKAVNPSSVMGATKRVAEMYVQSLGERSKTRFVAVRFGNVLGSAGSVVPIFKDQVARGGPVTVTHPDMCRYFMTIPEACQLLLQAATMGAGGEIFILDMGEPVKIVDLAKDVIRLSGFRPGEDIAIEYTGVRPGEKLFEELSVAEEQAVKTRHPKVFVGKISVSNWEILSRSLEDLVAIAAAGNRSDALRGVLSRLVPESTGLTTAEEPRFEMEAEVG